MNEQYRRRLPHFQPKGYAFFITFRLHDSLPSDVIVKLKVEHEERLSEIQEIRNSSKGIEYRNWQKLYFAKFDELLSQTESGPHWLKMPEVANILKVHIHQFDGIKYDLIAYTIMSNHVHLVIKPFEISEGTKRLSEYPVTKLMQELKAKTAFACNIVLNRKGKFWQSESYDHVVRDFEKLKRVVKYVLENPVKAGIVQSVEEYPHSYYNADKML